MSNITSSRQFIQQEETAAQAAVSESTMSRVGGAINFINQYQWMDWKFGALGPYDIGSSYPITDFGGKEEFQVASEITNVQILNGTKPSSGTVEMDIEWAPHGSGTWNSIFSMTPKIINTASDDVSFDSNITFATPTGCTAPVLSKTVFAVGDRLRFNIKTPGVGAKDFIMTISRRPVNP